MVASALVLHVAVALSALGQTITQAEIDEQNQNFKRWWDTELIWRYDDLPEKGSVPDYRIPYSGHDYPDRSGGTTYVLRKYDLAFHRGQTLAASYEQKDVTANQEPETREVRAGVFGLRRRRITVLETPDWHGHCNGRTAASIRHAEPQTSVTRNGVVFSPADIKALLADIYMYSATSFLGGVDYTINPGTLHVVLANWIGRGSHPVAMETTLGPVAFNHPIYAFETSASKRSERQWDVTLRAIYATSTNQEYNRSPRNHKTMHFHYVLDLDADAKIVGGRYYPDSARIDMLWVPLKPTQGGTEGNRRGNPHIDVKEVLSIWRESVPEELRKKWWNVDPPEEDRIQEATDQQRGGP